MGVGYELDKDVEDVPVALISNRITYWISHKPGSIGSGDFKRNGFHPPLQGRCVIRG
jgi:hypothetical protein